MKKILLAFYSSVICLVSFSQNAVIRGSVTDTSSSQPLSNAVISILHAKDSVLYKFIRTDEKGDFKLTNLDSGKYILLITYPQYADFADHISLNDSSQINLGQMTMISKTNLLKDIIIRSTLNAIRIKGDTTEFAADSF